MLIQKGTRRAMGGNRFWKAKYTQAAMRVQCLWRAIFGRARSSKVWMEIKGIKVDRLIRGLQRYFQVGYMRSLYVFQ